MPKLVKTTEMIDLHNAPPVVTIAEAERLLRVSRATVCRMIADSRLTARKMGHVVRVDTTSIRALIGDAPAAKYRAAA